MNRRWIVPVGALAFAGLLGAAGGFGLPAAKAQGTVTLLNVSYDPTRELYKDYNEAFSRYWLKKSKQNVTIKMSHGGSSKQARAIADGLEADVATLGLGYDIDSLEDAGLVNAGWEKRLPNNCAPYASTVVFLVRKGNPKGIKDWPDLVKPGVQVIPANPKTSGGARWAYLGAYGYALKKNKNNQEIAKDFVKRFYKNAPVLDSGARGATTTFAQRNIGDVLVGWENDAFLALNELGKDKFDIVVPSVSVLAEPSVAVVDKFVDKHGTRAVATAYLNYLYSREGQEIIGRHYFRARNAEVAKKYADQFPKVKLFTVDDTFGGWRKAQKTHFDDGGIFDQIYSK